MKKPPFYCHEMSIGRLIRAARLIKIDKLRSGVIGHGSNACASIGQHL